LHGNTTYVLLCPLLVMSSKSSLNCS
jgi:hypothetical protein